MGAPIDNSNDNPSGRWEPVTKSDSTILDLPRALYVGTAGNVVVQGVDDTTRTFVNVPAGSILPIRPKRVMAATTAADILAMF